MTSLVAPWQMKPLPPTSDNFQESSIQVDTEQARYHLQYDMQGSSAAKAGMQTAELHLKLGDMSIRLRMLKDPAEQQIVMHTPINPEQTQFYYNVKNYGVRVEGTVKFSDAEFTFGPSESGTFATRDWGRGVFKYKTYWMWATGMGTIELPGGHKMNLGLNFGHGFEDPNTVSAYEDCFWIDGTLLKLDPVASEIDESKEDRYHFFTANAQEKSSKGCARGSTEIYFTPIKKFTQYNNQVVVRSEILQSYGLFEGWFCNEKGEKVDVSDLYGSVEQNFAKW